MVVFSQYFPHHGPTSSSDSGQLYGSSREMGPPPLEFPPQPVEIDVDLNSHRTLPSPSTSGSTAWDPILQPHGFGDGPYGSSNMARIQQLPLDNQARGVTAQDPLYQWYTGNDGPWTPKVIPEVSEEKIQIRHIGNRNPVSYGSHYRHPNHSETGSVHFSVAPSDSGYGTRQSVGNTSVFSADVAERDQDCQSIVGHIENFQPFQGYSDVAQRQQQQDPRTHESWTSAPNSTGPNSPAGLMCPTCQKPVKTQSELKKHDLRHTKPFKCPVRGCLRTEGFSTTNDLDRHTRNEDFEEMLHRAEFNEKPTLEIDQDILFSQRSFQDHPRAAGPSVPESLIDFRRPELDWNKRLYPDVLSPPENPTAPMAPMSPMAPMAPKVPQLDKFEAKTVPPVERSLGSEASHSSTVQPLALLRPPTGVSDHKFTLESVLAPASSTDSAIEINDDTSTNATSQSKPQDKATRQNDVSAADAALTEVIRTALSGACIPDLSNDHVHTQELKRNCLPNGKSTTGSSWHSGPNAAITSRGRTTSHINLLDSPSPGGEIDEAHAQKTAAQLLKTLQEAGYTLRRDRSPSPKIQNLGSVASNKSENQVTCLKCRKFKGRPCELKKHMKRHERPYGCTFLTCNKTFGSKNDWKRHENSQHFQLETWRCDEERPEGGDCAKVCYRKQTFQEHLSKEHHITDEEGVKNKLEGCRIGRNCQARFWCGFCTKLVELKKKGLDAWTERFDHIDDHFMGRRGLTKQGIQDWIPVDSDKPKGDVQSDVPTGKEGHESGSDPSVSGSLGGTSPDSTGAPGGSSTDAVVADLPGSPKRKHSSGDENSRPQKQPRTANLETTIYCCHCGVAHNPKFNQSCTNCSDSHNFCQYCKHEITKT
ncbi:hypothetical protein LSUE1_G002827 [Lachnellula suecica]|uniref:C2H2-type domain-containing protein n=1 Tax=Lachnellula suecica TaxID=602035 RepID=A0A8T9CH77_9HELO|nr:hypothetical protein LSUE1_G002827 [Lachnellula suecica]